MNVEKKELLARLKLTDRETVLDALDIVLGEVTKEKVTASIQISAKHHQIVGYLHGGVSVLLAETVASIGSAVNIDETHQMAFGLEINANHLRPKRDGQLLAVATPVHLGRTTHVWDIRITDEKEKLICISRCTVAVVDRPADDGSESVVLAKQ